MKKVSIIIVHWNTPEILKNQLRRLTKESKLQIIVIDNASNKPLDWIKKDFPSVELINNKFNRGYAFACNQGVSKAMGGWLFFLNPDVEIIPQTIFQMVIQSEQRKLVATSPKTGSGYEKPLPTWLSLLTEFTPIKRLIGVECFKNKTLFGGCLLIKKNVLLALGGWDERFFLWFEDSDLTFRLLKNKVPIGWVDVVVKHSGGSSFNQLTDQYKKDIFFHSMDIFAKKYFSFFGRLVINLIKKKYSSRKLLPEIFDGVSITVPNIKKDLLDSFLQENRQAVAKIGELIVVTSALNNQELWNLRAEFPQIRFINIKENKGFASTVNIGFRVSSGKWVGTVNDDVILLDDWLEKLTDCPKKNVGSLNPVIKNPSGKIESVGVQILAKGKALPIINYDFSDDPTSAEATAGKRDQSRTRTYQTVNAANAAAVVYSKKALNEVGLFDENFGSYLEDIDLSLRLSRAGYENIVSLKSNVTHFGQSSSKGMGWKKNWLDFKNWILVIGKNWGVKKIIINFPSIFFERLRNLSGVIKTIFTH
ncbi:hypothetical protein COU86_05945 [Candidatus Roizmanbacteria bacterium CG10_big_fil_rev_8_21_14_0_10_36_26]|uniref:Glycosyltransferase 2-like domain-containing protein n=1 Tax=Candidatus Roizmanbacteria bacterium CG10_big_fil_rev_8_21_14_0_10_36_26 TaxID=1974851 RepID=A0A2M8KJN8_9BACT|nr:MAG: hypothetical protein COU86_05945 [Candidatus Roizmanbacteria bacterium CG10_big_fil_rev_8_21_14_0_10_36_26]